MNKWIVGITVMLPTLIEIMDTSVVNVSLDHIRGSLSAGIDEATWSITAYLVSNAIIIPMTGWLSRFFGRKRYLIFSISLFTGSSLLCGSAWSLQSLILFRIFQGIGGGGLQPLSQAILLETFPPHQHGIAMALFGVGIMFGPILGPLLGGWITDNWSWHWIFFINIPIGILSLIMTMFFIEDPSYVKGVKMKVDYWGFIFLAVGLGCLQVVLDKGQREDWFSSGFIIWLSVASVVSLTFFVLVEIFTENPIVNLKTFRNLSFTTGNAVMFFTFFNLFGSIVLLPIYVQTLMGYTASLAGMVLGPAGMVSLIAMPMAGRLITRMNPKLILAFGIVVSAYSTHLMSQFNLSADFYTIVWPRAVLGLGMGFLFIPLTTLTLSSINKEDMGNAASIYNLLRNLGASCGVAFVTTMLARRAQFYQFRLVEHLTPFDRTYQGVADAASRLLQLKGFEPALAQPGGLSLIYGKLMREASMLACNDTFHLLSVLTMLVLPLVFIMKSGKEVSKPGAFH